MVANAKNWRRHPETQRGAMSAALPEIGLADALLVRETKQGLEIIDGHLRADLCADQKVPVLVLDVTAEEADKLLATFDPLTGMAEVDLEALSALAEGLEFDNSELDAMLAELLDDGGSGEIVEDDPPAAQDGPCVAQVGDVWVCGRHRVLCGDGLDEEAVGLVVRDAAVDLCLTDPPYSVDYATSNELRRKAGSESSRQGIYDGYVDPPAEQTMRFLDYAPADVCVMTYMLHGRNLIELGKACERNRIELRWLLFWMKDSAVFSGHQSTYASEHEPILVMCRKGKKLGARVPANTSTVIRVDRPRAHEHHPTERPMELWAKLASWYGETGIYDPFLGSGTTLIAAEQLGRTCYGIEIEPRYVDVILKRYMNFTDESPVRESDGAKFSELVKTEASLIA